MINAQISHSIEVMETDLGTKLLSIAVESGETMEDFLVPHRLKLETSLKIIHIANQEVVNPTILPSADLTFNPIRALHLTNKSSLKTKLRAHLM